MKKSFLSDQKLDFIRKHSDIRKQEKFSRCPFIPLFSFFRKKREQA
ncbi:hypothetical protein SD77_2190 [Bacillus badius]|uniref:Uncharacterized protein n=1 Tax=Bacillus badius TaxID=1455 RepID=A0ABR5AYD0_BACBA|nr:hypothetical protein SD78_2346 [Bacillus badius]KIL79736.1 hypothetical protein SD77_2190 [Bacillus badius]